MRKLLLCMFAGFFLLLVSCGSNINTPDKGYDISSEDSGLSEVVHANANRAVDLDTLDIGGVIFNNSMEGQSAQYTTASFINEFRSFISNQAYSAAENGWDESYTALLLDHGNQTLLKLSISERSVTFDRDVEISGSLYKKGITYETGEWLYESMNLFLKGGVLNPVHLNYPAKVKIPREYNVGADIMNAGSGYISEYKTVTALHTFIESSITGREFEIAGVENLYSLETIQREEVKAAKARVIHINFDTMYLDISSGNEYDEMVTGYSMSLYKDPEETGLYRLAASGEVLLIKVDDAFDRAFQELFVNDAKSRQKLDASGVDTLFEQKKPYFMEYLCKNLGMETWNTREDDVLERSIIKLDNNNPYTVMSIKNPFDLRLLFFNNKSGAFIDYIDFGGREAGTDYTVQRSGKNAWIVGSRCLGHGTGVNIYNREWYTLDDNGKKLALSIPYDTFEVGPYVGNVFKAEGINLVNGDPIRLKVDYSITRIYMLEIDETDEYGQVKVTAGKKVEFVWDGSQRKFISEYPVDEQGITQINYSGTEISRKCGDILEREYDRLHSGIEALVSVQNESEKAYGVDSYKLFLTDCPNGAKKTALLKLLSQKAEEK